jgi:4'-phosphopantetheinyl transferase
MSGWRRPGSTRERAKTSAREPFRDDTDGDPSLVLTLPDRPDGGLRLPLRLSLAAAETQVWCANLDVELGSVERLGRLLSAEELRRAERFLHHAAGRRYRVARAVLRLLLAGYLDAPVRAVSLEEGGGRKPSLRSPRDRVDLRFNVSHSDRLALFAFALGRELGVDVERIRSDRGFLEIATSHFTPEENAGIARLPEHRRLEGFFVCWTRKEAYLKAIGEGLARPLSSFRVGVSPLEACALIEDRLDGAAVERWRMRDVRAARGWVASLVEEGAPQLPPTAVSPRVLVVDADAGATRPSARWYGGGAPEE